MHLTLRFLSSLRLGVVLIALLALACIAGSLIAADENLGVDHGRAWVFHTPWFLGLMGLLLVNLCLCSWEKSYIALTLYKKKNAITTPRFYEKATHAFIVPWQGSLEALESLLRRRYTTFFKRGNAFYVQKGLIGRTGATIIHIGLLWTMSAGFYRILADDMGWGVFDSTIILPEGETTQSYFSRIDRLKKADAENLREKKVPFSVHCLDFKAEFHPHSTVAARFSSLIEIRDGEHSQISEVTMQEPMLYKGFKITQNSFSPNEMVQRGKFQVVDQRSGQRAEFDAAPHDPVKIPLPEADHLFFQATDLAPKAAYQIVDLASRKVVQTGELEGVKVEPPHDHDHGEAPLPINLEPLERDLEGSQYAMLVAALFPNFVIDDNRQPTTRDENFDNPAVLVMLFKNGRPNGYTWLFNHAEAQKIVGQTHPEVDMNFASYRKKEGSDGTKGLFDYEVELRLTEKKSGKDLGTHWVTPGKVTKIEGVTAEILSAPNVDPAAEAAPGHGHGQGAAPGHGQGQDAAPAHGPHDHDHVPGSSGSTAPAEAATSASVHGGGAAGAMAAGGQPAQSRFAVTYLGPTTGHVTYLGFMKDPSVTWLFSGCIIIVLGTLIAFMITYREAWIWYDEESGLLYMATSVRGTSPGAHREFDRIVQRMMALSAAPDEAEERPLAAAAPVG